MRLSTKISAAAVGLLLFFSQAFSVWNLAEIQKTEMQNALRTERERMERILMEFRAAYQSQRHILTDERSMIFWGRTEFQDGYSLDSVLYCGGEEVSNSTPYVFDLEHLKEAEPDRALEAAYDGEKVLLGETEGRTLLLLYNEVSDSDFSILHYRDVTPIYEESRNLWVRGTAAALFLALLLLLALTLTVRRILEPFYRLRDAAARVAAGDYGVRIARPGRDEVGEVAGSFNDMAQRVEEHVRGLAETNEKQRRLLGALSHELKTPMTGIQGYAELLQRVELPKKKQMDALNYIEQECRRLSRLSVKLLQLTGLSGEEKIERKPIEVRRLFAQTETMLRHRLAGKKLRLEFAVEDGAETIEGDEDLLLSLLTNLGDNAVKASAPGGVIRFTACAEGIFVRDEGEGIPAEEIAKVTEPFYMVDKSRSRQEGGAGLGLALCAQIARLHGMRLQITSRPGQGTTAGICRD